MPQGTGATNRKYRVYFKVIKEKGYKQLQKVKKGNKALGINKNLEEKESDLGIEGKKKERNFKGNLVKNEKTDSKGTHGLQD